MAINKELLGFVGSALEKGASKQEISDVLTAAGWDNQDINQALSAYSDTEFVVPVPAKKHSLAARDTVFYLFLFTLLYLVSFGLIFLAFNILDLVLPDAGRTYPTPEVIESNVRYWISWSVVFTPCYLFVAFKSAKRDQQDTMPGVSKGRQWLTYLTLFVASMTALGDLVALVWGVLDGDATTKFLLKTLFVAVVSAVILLYYYRDIKAAETATGVGHEY